MQGKASMLQEINHITTAATDEDIVTRVRSGVKADFELLMRKHNQRLFRTGMVILYDADEVEEMMQSAYVKAYEHLDQFLGKSSFGTWLMRIFVNECLGTLKRKKRAPAISPDLLPAAEQIKTEEMQTPDRNLLNKELAKALEQALVGLPEKYRIVFVMREVEEMSVAETREVLGITESNVKVRLSRAKLLLRDALSSYYHRDGLFQFHLLRCDRVVSAVMARLSGD